nr:MAG TPA_asm: hypothetical protein [Caudoviricetes sp.]
MRYQAPTARSWQPSSTGALPCLSGTPVNPSALNLPDRFRSSTAGHGQPCT